jgi:hypothetical protein
MLSRRLRPRLRLRRERRYDQKAFHSTFCLQKQLFRNQPDDQPLMPNDSEVAREVALRLSGSALLPEIRLLG